MSETAHTPKTTLQVLIDARALIEKPKNWCQGTLHKERMFGFLHSYCMVGALDESGQGVFSDARERLREIECYGAIWNDAPDRTHAEVLAAFDKAIEAERAKVSA